MSNVSVPLFPNGGSHYDPAIAGVLTVVVAGTAAFLWGARTLARFRPKLTRPGSSAAPGEEERGPTDQPAPWKRRMRSWTASARSGTGPSTGRSGTTARMGRVRTGGGGTPRSAAQAASCSDELT